MAHLATVASHHVNGVAALHSRLLRETVLRDFAELWPERFTNVTNGVTPRRFVALANPRLAALITEAIGDGWLRDLDRLRELEPLADDAAFRDALARGQARQQGARSPAGCARRTALGVDPASLFDAQCKRIHEYKRQHLNLLHVDRAVATASGAATTRRSRRARSCFAGKAAPGVPHGQADHPARRTASPRRSPPTRARATACASCSCPTST